MLVFGERGKPDYPGKNLSEKRTNKLNPHDSRSRNHIQATLVESECSRSTALTLLGGHFMTLSVCVSQISNDEVDDKGES